MIPKRIIQIWKSDQPPRRYQDSIGRLRTLHPDFEHLLYSDDSMEAFVEERYPELLEFYRSLRFPIQRADLYRILAVLALGGFYFDLDVNIVRPLDDLLSYDAVFPFEKRNTDALLQEVYGFGDLLGNYAFGARAGHPFLRAVVDNIVRAVSDPAWAAVPEAKKDKTRMVRTVFYTTGPVLLTRTYVERSDLAASVHILYPENPDDRTGWDRFGDYGTHDRDSNWLPLSPSLAMRRVLQKILGPAI